MSARWFAPWRAGLLSALVALVLGLSGCGREPAEPLRIGTNVWIGSEPLYLARELGHLSPEAVRLVEYPSASEVLRAFRNQALDGMVISLDEVLVLAADDLQPRIVLVVDVSHGADVVIGRSGMRTMRDLLGKRVAVESGALGAYVLSRALALNQMQPSDVQIVHLESNEHPAAFEQGRVDAAVTFDPFRSRMVRSGASTLFDSTQIPGEIVDLLVVRGSVLEEDPQSVNAMLSGWFEALDYLERQPGDAARRMSVRQQTSGEQFLQTLQGLRFPSREQNLKMLGGAAPDLAVAGRRLVELMTEAKLLKRRVEVEALLAPDPLLSMPR
ncbi:MAG: ABC transporter substrate-binding protein [Sterolibacteriaceae bacterium]|nr:ABC transporter substrate-binding protein [Sterolibacteriaceae bacterium]MBK9086179.1 ABC transporter substrate-binding protein [Sterolibacteriaceae bacterium]